MSQQHQDYIEFLKGKIKLANHAGFEIDESEINPILKGHQKAIVKWAVYGGNRAIFAAFGLGKSVMQIETLRLIHSCAGGKVLVVVPLGVRQEFKRDGAMLGVHFEFIRRPEEMTEGQDFYLTNYESIRDGRLDPNIFTAVSLDEASVLRSYGSKTYQEFLTLFNGVKYKFVATATPSPNRYKELIHYAGFLGIMDTGQALTRFFQRDSTQANNLTLYPHKEKEFWFWLHSWAIFLQKPSDLGFDDTGYDLPPLNVVYHEVCSDHSTAGFEKNGQGLMFKDAALGLQAAAAEKRDSLAIRVEKIKEVICGYSGIQQGVLREKQGSSAGIAKGTKQEELSSEPECVQREISSLEGCEPRKSKGVAKESLCQECTEDHVTQRGVVCEQQGTGGKERSNCEAEDVRIDARGIPVDSGSARSQLRDLQNEGCSEREAKPDVCGSLPHNWESSRTTLPEVQFRTRNVQGRSGNADDGDQLPDQIVIWCNLNDEQKAIESMLKNIGVSFVSLYGNQDIDAREKELQRWINKEATVFLSKTEMYGSGVNMQQAHIMIFAGVDYKFNSFIQGVHRIYRFLQTEQVEIHVIHSEAEREVLRALQAKWQQHKEMVEKMGDVIRQHGLNDLSMHDILARTIGVERLQVDGKLYSVANNDCVIEARRQEDDSMGLIVTSIPFSNHYEYTPSYNDFGHTENNDHFWQQMDFLTPELLRILIPGRMYCCHVKDRILFGNVTGAGAPTVSPFHCEAIMHARKHGFDYMGMITVVTDVVRENNQTYRLGWSEQCKDGTKMGVGSPEYVLLFRKPQSDRTRGYGDIPVVKSKQDYTRGRWQVDAHAFWRSSGNRMLTADDLADMGPDKLAKAFTEYSLNHVYDYEHHVKIGEDLEARGALPSTFMSLAPGSHDDSVWHDINRMLTLNTAQSQKRAMLHVCPLQFDIIDRLIVRYSNPGDRVYDPFCGLGSVPYRAIKLGRTGQGSELNTCYFFDSVQYLNAMEREVSMPDLFSAFDLKEDA